MSREDARWAVGLVVGLGVAVYGGVLTWKQALGGLGYLVWFSVMLAAGLALALVSMALTGVGLELFEWFCKRFRVLGSMVGRVFYGALSALILVLAARVAWHVARDMIALALASPGTLLVGLLFIFWFPLVYGLVVLARAIWRRRDTSRGRAAGPNYVDAEFRDLGEPPQPGKSGRREG
jgi:hypothetical protein